MITAFVPSHFMPSVPTAWALRTAGHEVVVVGLPDIAAAARRAGLPTATIGGQGGGFSSFVRPGQVGPGRAVSSSTPAPPAEPGAPAATTAHELAARLPWDRMAEGWQALISGLIQEYVGFAAAWKPDLILGELDFNGLITGALLGIPAVGHRWGPELLTSYVRDHARTGLADFCAGLGLADGFPDGDLWLDPCPPSLQFPGLPPATPVGFVPYNGTGDLPPWALEDRTVRRIFASFGVFGAQATAQEERLEFVTGLCQAAGKLGEVEIVVPFGEDFRAEAGTLPESVRVVEPTPLNLVLNVCDLVIHHGGGGTALTACAFGVPQLVLPQPGPVFVGCGERVAARGVGLMLAEPGPQDLGQALGELLEDPSYRGNAREVAEEMRRLPGPGRLVGMLEAVAAAAR